MLGSHEFQAVTAAGVCLIPIRVPRAAASKSSIHSTLAHGHIGGRIRRLGSLFCLSIHGLRVSDWLEQLR